MFLKNEATIGVFFLVPVEEFIISMCRGPNTEAISRNPKFEKETKFEELDENIIDIVASSLQALADKNARPSSNDEFNTGLPGISLNDCLKRLIQ